MRSRDMIRVSVVALVLGLLTASSASASTEIGVRCQSTGAINGYADVNTTTPAFAAPSSGVITRWGKNVFVAYPTDPVVLIVVHGSGLSWKVVGQSQPEFMPALGDVEWSTQIPITAGDRIGEAGAVENCAGDAADHTDYQSIYPNLTTVGQTLSLTQGSPNSRTALWAKLEPDADHDGFGDESQDGCPNNAQLQVACPKPILSAFKLTSLNSFQALITTDFVTTVTGVGTVKLPAAKGKKGKRLTLSSKTIATAPGTQQKLTIKYPSALKHALAELSHKKSLTLNVTITAVGVFENGVKTFKVKLPGKK